MKRKNMNLPRSTTKHQLHKHWEFRVAKFRINITELVNDLPHNPIGKFDEVSIKRSMHLGYTINNKGAMEIRIKNTRSEKNVLLSIC